ncbi:hypothetical protein [Brachybacterium sp. AOP35-5H-19]|uniref:hypothetical protein n=1 Tax=Brachybacterium sp. AOP35-5H-19 TaxID=3457685 RepID=UPI0040345252
MRHHGPHVRLWRWSAGTIGEMTGAKIRFEDRVVFVPARYLRRVADQLHGIADRLEDGLL